MPRSLLTRRSSTALGADSACLATANDEARFRGTPDSRGCATSSVRSRQKLTFDVVNPNGSSQSEAEIRRQLLTEGSWPGPGVPERRLFGGPTRTAGLSKAIESGRGVVDEPGQPRHALPAASST